MSYSFSFNGIKLKKIAYHIYDWSMISHSCKTKESATSMHVFQRSPVSKGVYWTKRFSVEKHSVIYMIPTAITYKAHFSTANGVS